MGRYDLSAQRVHQTATLMLQTKRIAQQPPWYEIVGTIPPSQVLQRPLQPPNPQVAARKAVRKRSKMFQPIRLTYPEDQLREEFFGDHPWELARPRMILEDDGLNGTKYNWSSIVQKGKRLDGESVVQRQLYLQTHDGLSKPAAYDQARKEFYHHRFLEDVARRVAREEALHVGACFGASAIDVGMQLEDQAWEDWRRWARREIDADRLRTQSAYSGAPAEEAADEEAAAAALPAELEDELVPAAAASSSSTSTAPRS